MSKNELDKLDKLYEMRQSRWDGLSKKIIEGDKIWSKFLSASNVYLLYLL